MKQIDGFGGTFTDTYRLVSKEVYETECSTGTGSNNPAIDMLILATRSWVRAVLLWNIIKDTQNGPALPGGCVECTPLVTIDRESGAVMYRFAYYRLGQGGLPLHASSRRYRHFQVGREIGRNYDCKKL